MFSYLLFIHGNHCYTVRQRLGSEHALLFEPRIFKRKSLELLLLEFGRKNYQGVEETCIFDNPLFHTEFVAYFEKDSKLNFNTRIHFKRS